MKDRARGKRDLMKTGRAFIQTSSADLPVFFSTAFGAYESLRPTSLEQPVNAVFFRSKFFLENHPTHVSVVGSVPLSFHGNHNKKQGELSQ